eukprot:XP_023158067.1 protein CTR9 homolog [Zea mays]
MFFCVREKVELATKFVVSFADDKREIRGDPSYVRATCEASLKWLGVDYIDLYYQHCIDKKVPIEVMVRATVTKLQNAIRVFSLLSVASTYHSHGFDERKIETHVEYCKHLLDAAKVHRDAAEQAEQQNKQKMEVARQIALADEARRRAEEQRKFQLERRREEDELKQVKQQEEHFQRVKGPDVAVALMPICEAFGSIPLPPNHKSVWIWLPED